ncbi:MAG: DMT family transporter [Alicyclobacillus sp.]|nr:DMT family transporter [Alicyclobacillus sp.]
MTNLPNAVTLCTMNKQQQLTANLALLLVTLVWGATFTLTKTALASIPAFAFLSVRFVLATLALAVLVLCTPSARKTFNRQTWYAGIGIGLVLFGTYAFQTVGLQYTSPANAGFITGLSVVLVPILGILILRRTVGPRTWVAALLSSLGLLLLCGVNVNQPASPHGSGIQPWYHTEIWGDVLVLICAILVALQILLVERHGQSLDPLALATVEIATVTVCSIVSALMMRQTAPLAAWVRPSVLMALLICAWPATSLAYYAQNVFQKFTSAAQTAIIFSMEPVFAAIIAWMALRQPLKLTAGLGGLLILIGMLLADPNIRWPGIRPRQIRREG